MAVGDTCLAGGAGPLKAAELLDAVCDAQTMLCGGSGAPDHNRAGRAVVRAYVDGVLLYCHAPPTCDEPDAFAADTRATALVSTTALAAKLRDVADRANAGNRHHARVLHDVAKAGFAVETAEGAAAADVPPPAPVEKVARRKPITNRSNKAGKKKSRQIRRNETPYGEIEDPDLLA